MTLIIAEAGVNHNGQEELAFALVDAAHKAGADIVKFQTFKAKNLATSEAKLAEYQVANTKKHESQLSMLSRLELSYDAHHKLVEYCSSKNIEFMSTAFDLESLQFLVDDLGLKRLKIASGELTNAPLLLEHARSGCDLVVSTGMASLSEIELALGVIAFGYTASKVDPPSIQAFQEAYASFDGQLALKEKVVILHCTTEYPAPIDEINLRAMDTLGGAFSLPVGYSDHSQGISVPIAAAARGAVIVEKHFTLSRKMKGPDHKASLEPQELEEMITSIRNVSCALGNSLKAPTKSENKNKNIARKSIVASRDIEIGEILTDSNLSIMRPGEGMSPYLYWELMGRSTKRAYRKGELIFE